MRESPRLAARRKRVRGSRAGGSSSSPVLEKSKERRTLEGRKRVELGGNLRFGKSEDGGGMSALCREPDTALHSARRARRLSNSDSFGGICARHSYSIENIPISFIEMKSLATEQKDLTAKRNEFARKAHLQSIWMCTRRKWETNQKSTLS